MDLECSSACKLLLRNLNSDYEAERETLRKIRRELGLENYFSCRWDKVISPIAIREKYMLVEGKKIQLDELKPDLPDIYAGLMAYIWE